MTKRPASALEDAGNNQIFCYDDLCAIEQIVRCCTNDQEHEGDK